MDANASETCIFVGRADMAFGAISILSSRSAVVDFSAPYYESSFSMMAKKKPNPNILYFSFIEAFSLGTWGMFMLMIVLASIALVGVLHKTLRQHCLLMVLFD